jgi:hypothetical protein
LLDVFHDSSLLVPFAGVLLLTLADAMLLASWWASASGNPVAVRYFSKVLGWLCFVCGFITLFCVVWKLSSVHSADTLHHLAINAVVATVVSLLFLITWHRLSLTQSTVRTSSGS